MIEDNEKCYELIKDLAYEYIAYSEDFEIIDNPEKDLYSEKEDEYLRFPYAVRLFLPNTERWIGKDFSCILFINETMDGLIYWHEDTPIDVDHYGWMYVGYCTALETEIVRLRNELSKTGG